MSLETIHTALTEAGYRRAPSSESDANPTQQRWWVMRGTGEWRIDLWEALPASLPDDPTEPSFRFRFTLRVCEGCEIEPALTIRGLSETVILTHLPEIERRLAASGDALMDVWHGMTRNKEWQ